MQTYMSDETIRDETTRDEISTRRNGNGTKHPAPFLAGVTIYRNGPKRTETYLGKYRNGGVLKWAYIRVGWGGAGQGRTPTYLSFYLPSYLPTYPPAYLPTYKATDLPIYLPKYLPTQQPTYQITNPLIYIRSHLPTYLPTCLPKYRPTYIHTNAYILVLRLFKPYNVTMPIMHLLVEVDVPHSSFSGSH